MRRTYNAAAVIAPLPSKKPASPTIDPDTRQRLLRGLGEAANRLCGHAEASEILTRVLGPGWSPKQLQRERLRMAKGRHYYQKGRNYSYDLAAIVEWYLSRSE